MKNCTVSLTEINVNSNNATTSFPQENKLTMTSNDTSLLFDNDKSKSRKRKSQTQCIQKDIYVNNKNQTSSNNKTTSNNNNNDSSFLIERPSKKSRIEINQNKTMPGTPNKALRRITLGPAQLGPSVDLYLFNSLKKKQQEAEAQMQVSPKKMKQLPKTKSPKKETSVRGGRRNSLAVVSSNIDLKPSKKYAQKIENSPSMQTINIPKPTTSTKRKSLPTTKTNGVTVTKKSSKTEVNASSPSTRNKNISKLVGIKTTPGKLEKFRNESIYKRNYPRNELIKSFFLFLNFARNTKDF